MIRRFSWVVLVVSGILFSAFCSLSLLSQTTIGKWQHKGTVLASSSGHNPQQPNVIYEANAHILSGTVFKMWYNDFTGTVPQISYAESTNGTAWTTYPSNPVIAGQGWPKVFKNGATYYLYSSPNGFTTINAYTSTDGITWTLAKPNAITLGTAGQWDSSAIVQLSIIDIIAGTWYGYYAGYVTPNQWKMGLATSPDGINWTKGASNPVITANGPSNFDWHKVGSTYYGWSQVVLPGIPPWILTAAHAGIFYPSDIQRFRSASVTGPFTLLPQPVFYRTQSSEGPTVFGGQVADSSALSDGTNLWIFFTATPAGDGEDGQSGPWMINAAEVPNTSFAQLVGTYEGIQSFPAFTPAGLQLYQSAIGSDNFTRANENPLSNGGKWSVMGGGPSTVQPAQLLSNVATALTTTQASCSLWTGTTANNDQWASATVGSATALGDEVGVVLRGSTGAFTGYLVYWLGTAGSSTSTLNIQPYVAGSVQGTNQLTNVTFNVGDTLTAFINGANAVSVYQNGFLIFSAISSTTIASGQPGLIVYGGGTTPSSASLTAWGGGNIVNAPAIATKPFLPLVIRP